jgi:proteasome accessory factor A
LKAAQREHGKDSENSWLLREWKNILNDLERDVATTADRLDWVAKKFLLSSFREEEKLSWTDPWLQAIDLEYHNIQPDQGLFYELQRQGTMRNLISEKEIKDAIFTPPETTRAWFRGRAVARFNHAISSIQWDEIAFSDGKRSRVVKLLEPAGDSHLEKLNALVNAETEFEDFFRALDSH